MSLTCMQLGTHRSVGRTWSRAFSPLAAAQSSGMQPWQLARLQRAASQGRRQVKVEKLCKDLQLPRASVLQWLKDNPTAEQDRNQRLEPARELSHEQGVEEDEEGRSWEAAGAVPGRQQQRQGQGVDGWQGVPAWKRREQRGMKSLGRQAEATLEMVYARTPWPSDEVVESMWDLHRLRKDKVIEWFQNRRRQVRQGGKQGGSQAQGASSGLDWFDEAGSAGSGDE